MSNEIGEFEFIGSLAGLSLQELEDFCSKYRMLENITNKEKELNPAPIIHYSIDDDIDILTEPERIKKQNLFKNLNAILRELNRAEKTNTLIKRNDLGERPQFFFISITSALDYEGETGKYFYNRSDAFKWANESGYDIPNENKDISISEDKNLKWNDITITFLNDTEFHCQYGHESATRSYKRAGFADNRGGGSGKKPIGAWTILLEASKERSGTIPWQIFSRRKTVEKHAQKIRKKFRALFPGIDPNTDPIPLDKKNKEYKPVFRLYPPNDNL